MDLRWKLVAAAGCAATSLVTNTALADFEPFAEINPAGYYCVDGADYFPFSTTQHVAVAYGNPFIGSCQELADNGGPGPYGPPGGDDYIEELVYSYTGRFRPIEHAQFEQMGAVAEYLSTSMDGALWAINEEPSPSDSELPTANAISVYANGAWTVPAQLPGGRVPDHVAALSATHGFVLGKSATDDCAGGECIWEIYAGYAPSMFASDLDPYLGAIAIAYDDVTGKLWRVDDQGHVYSLETWTPAPGNSFTYWVDRGVSGLPPDGAIAIAVYDDIPMVIGNTGDSMSGGQLYTLSDGGWWYPYGSLSQVTDVAIDPTSGVAWAVTYNGPQPPTTQTNGNNLWHWVPYAGPPT
jgi:hypothetical protein